jgi:hypothetical protein
VVGIVLVVALALSGQPWPRHTIDNTSKGADGVRLADVNADGLLDVVTGWEEGGLIRIYFNPGKAKAKAAWPQVTVGRVKSPEDAVAVDLDDDGALDVVSSCEGQTRAMFVHWAPRDKAQYIVSDAWRTEKMPAPECQWMYALPMHVDGSHGVDLVIGAKCSNGKLGWLAAPENPRDVAKWTFHELAKAAWIMTITSRDFDGDGDRDVIYSDRKGKESGVYWLENRGADKPWPRHMLGASGREVMFLDADAEVVAALKPNEVMVLRPGKTIEHLKFDDLPIGHAKAVTLADIDGDGRSDLILTCEGAVGVRSGVVWTKLSANAPVYDISGSDGVKFDLAPTVDLDGDGDLDVVTTEEAENLGVIWYENPTR